MRTEFDAEALEATITLLAARLDRHREELNRLNVYPVRDSDTGDNLMATIGSVTDQLARVGDDTLVDAIANGALRGGRGSSGVIFGAALRGFVTSLPDRCGADGLASALTTAATAAREAVADPVEGTILTVADDAAREARRASDGTVADVARAAADEGRRSLARTPELLASLAEAGVVDAGGLGYVLFLDTLAEVLTGAKGAPLRLSPPVGCSADEQATDGGRYEVVCLLSASEDRVAWLRDRWRSLGDAVAIAGAEADWRCHVHTDDVVAALAAAREAGPISEVEATDLAGQNHGSVSVVALAGGDELAATYLRAGAQRVVVPGSAETSTAHLQRVVDACTAPVVVVESLAGLLALEVVGPLCNGDSETLAARLEDTARQIQTVDVPASSPAKDEDALMTAARAVVAPDTTWALLAVDQKAPADDDAFDRLRRAHPHVKWLKRRTNRPSCAYGIAVG
jgi:uncharacterized protein